MVGLPGPELDDSTLSLIQNEKIHNFILFRRNVTGQGQLKSLCSDLTAACLDNNLPRPLISIDQEGGKVARLSEPFTVFPDPRDLTESSQCEEKLRQFAETCARELLAVGINMNLAPVLDICEKGSNLFMERRCLGDTPERVSALGRIVIEGMQNAGLSACAKHFPGLGAATLDPHLEIPVVELSADRIENVEVQPFVMAREVDVAAVMTSHAVYSSIDDLPATLSQKTLQGLLREKCGFSGLIITDDMEMGAIEKFMEFNMANLKAFQAGSDMLLICHDHDKVRGALQGITAALESGEITSGQVHSSLQRQARVLQRFVL